LVLFNLHCHENQEASVLKLNGSAKDRLPVGLAELTGLRDGEIINISARFQGYFEVKPNDGLRSPDSLILQIQLQFGVPTRFRSGSFRWHEKDQLFQGSLSSTSVSYHGGQGGLPSMDGRFQFEIRDHGQYETYIPTTEIVRP